MHRVTSGPSLENRLIDPPLADLSSLKTPLTKGERQFLELCDRSLSLDWSIFVQPHLNGLRPDFVLLNPNVGIAVYEVKDWDLGALRYEYRIEAGSRTPKLWAHDGRRWFSRDQDDPVKKVDLYKREIFRLYCPSLRSKSDLGIITAGVVFPFAGRSELETLLLPIREHFGHSRLNRIYPIVARDDFSSGKAGALLPASSKSTDARMNDIVAMELRHWLFEPEVSIEQRRVPPLDPRQKELTTSRTSSGYRRIKGPAGSGKSLVLAARAASLLATGQRVLVLTYNITLRQYLRDVAAQFGLAKQANVEWLHFHDWCKRVCVLSGNADEYSRLWRGTDAEAQDVPADHGSVLASELAGLVTRILSDNASSIQKYDAILVDEGQDFRPEWWSALKLALVPGGEAMLVADLTQNIYGTANAWTEGVMHDAGFAARWVELRGSYRLPAGLLPLAQDFAKLFLPEGSRDLPDSPQHDLPLDRCTLRWRQVPGPSSIWTATKEEIDRLVGNVEAPTPSFADVTVVCQTKEAGTMLVRGLESMSLRVAHTFDKDAELERKRKLHFYKGHPGVKVTTIHSFKGWESSCLVVVLTNARDEQRLAEAYTALTRIKRTVNGSHLVVICSDSRLSEYGWTWPSYTRDEINVSDLVQRLLTPKT